MELNRLFGIMKTTLFQAALIIFGATLLFANPLAVDSSRRPVTMTAEKVVINVRSGSSNVKGTYTFHQENDDWPEQEDTHVIIFVPVLLPDRGDNSKHDAPMISVGNTRFKSRIRNDIPLEGTPISDVNLPKGWHMEIYECSIPLNLLQKTFSIKVSYTQPHFKGDVSGYVPINPPRQEGSSVITFRAEPGYALKPYRQSLFHQASYPTIAFIPENRTLIRVKCIQNGEQGAAANP